MPDPTLTRHGITQALIDDAALKTLYFGEGIAYPINYFRDEICDSLGIYNSDIRHNVWARIYGAWARLQAETLDKTESNRHIVSP